jgi:rubredoxin-NAD+ reductase
MPSLVLTRAADMAKQLDIKLLVETEVHAINRAGKQLDTTSGTLEYDKLVLALGADPIRIPLQGDAANEVMSVNDLADYAKLRAALDTPKSVAIMGGGLIGCEFANDLAVAGYAVSVIDPGAYPLASLMPEQAGKQLLEPLAKLGAGWARYVHAFMDKVARLLTAADGSILNTAAPPSLPAPARP